MTPDQLKQVEDRYFSLQGISRARYMQEVKKVNTSLAGHLGRLSQTRRKATRTAWEAVKQKFIATPISNIPQGSFSVGGWTGNKSKNGQVAVLVNEFDSDIAVSGSFKKESEPATKSF